jgi:hypothetical protein
VPEIASGIDAHRALSEGRKKFDVTDGGLSNAALPATRKSALRPPGGLPPHYVVPAEPTYRQAVETRSAFWNKSFGYTE